MINPLKPKMSYFFSQFSIPELQIANKLYNKNKFIQAHENYERVYSILQSAKMINSPQYLQIQKKLIACLYLMKKYDRVTRKSQEILNLNFTKHNNYFQFSYYCSCAHQNIQPSKIYNNNVKDLTSYLLNPEIKNLNNQIQQQFPIISQISKILNCRSDVKNLLVSLIQRQKSNQIVEKTLNHNIHSSLQLLQAIAITLSCPNNKKQSKKVIHQRLNQILQEYQKDNPEKVYLPLLCLSLSLIEQKNYMSAQGMIGYIKGQISNMQYKVQQDEILTNNIYRILVTRANNEDYDVGIKKQEKLNFGKLVCERIIQSCLNLY